MREEINKHEGEPVVVNIGHPKLRAHFETYDGHVKDVNGEEEFDDIREEITRHFAVPLDNEHMFIIDNKMVIKQRHYRAWCVLIREENGQRSAYYIDGRLPHATMLQRLYNYYGVTDDERNIIHLGFLDDEGFSNAEGIPEEAREKGWFIRETISSS